MRCSVLEPIDVRTHISYHILRVYSGFLIYIYIYLMLFKYIYICVCVYFQYIFILYTVLFVLNNFLIKGLDISEFLVSSVGATPNSTLQRIFWIPSRDNAQLVHEHCRRRQLARHLVQACSSNIATDPGLLATNWMHSSCKRIYCIFTQDIPSTICTFCIMIAWSNCTYEMLALNCCITVLVPVAVHLE